MAEGGDGIAGTITVHHLILNRNHLLVGRHPAALLLPAGGQARDATGWRCCRAATGGDARFFLGTDSAPHAVAAKEAACGCAGVFSAPVAMAWLAQVFEEEGALDRLEGFASLHGPAFYRLPPNPGRMRLERSETPWRRRRGSRPAPGRWRCSTRAFRCTGASSTERSRDARPASDRRRRWRG